MIAAIYSRKSKQTEKGESVENQVQMCKEYAKKNLGINNFIIYEDEGFSGGNINRPQFQKMLKDSKNKKFSVLICYRLDRVSRNVADFSNTIESLQKNNVDFVSIREQFDTSTPMGRAMMNIAAVFAQLERETIAERIKDNMIELAKTGRWLGGTPPLGYKSEPITYSATDGKEKKMFKLKQVPEELETVQLIYDLYLNKNTFSSVSNYLCKNQFKGKNSGEFSRETVKQIINNSVYCISDEKIMKWFRDKGATICGDPDGVHGLMVYNKREGGKIDKPINEWVVSIGKHKGLITSDIWIECQKINEKNNKKSSPRSGTGEKFLLSGLVVCGECSSGMASWSHFNKKRDFMERYYRCNLKNRASNRCSNKMLNAYKAEDYVIEHLKKINIRDLIKNYTNLSSNISIMSALKTQIESFTKIKETNNKTIQGLIRKIALLEDDIDLIEMFKEEINKIKYENADIDKQLNELSFQIDNVSEDEINLNDIVGRFETFKDNIDLVESIEIKRQLIQSVVDNIVWFSDSETLEINLIGSSRKLPNGAVRRRLCFGNGSR